MLPTNASSLSMGTARCDRAPPNRAEADGPPASSAVWTTFLVCHSSCRVFQELHEMPHASDEIRQVFVVRQLKPQGETAFRHNDTARRTLLRRCAPRSLASPETPAPTRRVSLR